MTFILRSCMKNYTYALLSLAYCIRFRRTTSDSKFINFRRFPTLYVYVYVLYCNWWDCGVAKRGRWRVRWMGVGGSLPTVWGRNKLLVSHTVFLYETFHYYAHTNAEHRAQARFYRYISTPYRREFFVYVVVRDRRKLCSCLSDTLISALCRVPPPNVK